MRSWLLALIIFTACDKGSDASLPSWLGGSNTPAPAKPAPANPAPANPAPANPAPANPAPASPALAHPALANPAAPAAPTPAAPAPASPPAPPAPKTWNQGDRIQGQWSDGLWYNGRIGAVHSDGTYDIAYDDGDHADHLGARHVRARGAASSGGGASSSSDAPCPGPGITRRCGGTCVNVQEDNNNCGSCGNRCPAGKQCDGHMFCRDAEGNL